MSKYVGTLQHKETLTRSQVYNILGEKTLDKVEFYQSLITTCQELAVKAIDIIKSECPDTNPEQFRELYDYSYDYIKELVAQAYLMKQEKPKIKIGTHFKKLFLETSNASRELAYGYGMLGNYHRSMLFRAWSKNKNSLSKYLSIELNSDITIEYSLEPFDKNAIPSYYVNRNSCWFGQGGYGNSRFIFDNLGGYALVAKRATDTRNTFRAWVLGFAPEGEVCSAYMHNKNMLCANLAVFNVYSDIGNTDSIIKAIFAELGYNLIAEKSSSYIAFDDDNFYTNAQQRDAYNNHIGAYNRAVLIFSKVLSENELPRILYSGESYDAPEDFIGYCIHCNTDLYENDDHYHIVNDNIVCDDCYNDNYGHCEYCHNDYNNDDVVFYRFYDIRYWNNTLTSATYCEECAHDNGLYCEEDGCFYSWALLYSDREGECHSPTVLATNIGAANTCLGYMQRHVYARNECWHYGTRTIYNTEFVPIAETFVHDNFYYHKDAFDTDENGDIIEVEYIYVDNIRYRADTVNFPHRYNSALL